jgi:hypothetical protein
MVVAVVAHPGDRASAALVRRWSSHDALLLTGADLSRPGWNLTYPGAAGATVVIDGRRIDTAEIDGVLVRTPAIAGDELAAVVAGDRDYCAAEMTAFLTWWLTELRCPVVNRPTAVSLAGPGWSEATWHVVAARHGLARPAARWRAAQHRDRYAAGRRPTPPSPQPDVRVVTVVGGRCVGPADARLARYATALARAAGVDALAATFRTASDPPEFLRAGPWVDITDAAIAGALLERLLPHTRAPAREAS